MAEVKFKVQVFNIKIIATGFEQILSKVKECTKGGFREGSGAALDPFSIATPYSYRMYCSEISLTANFPVFSITIFVFKKAPDSILKPKTFK